MKLRGVSYLVDGVESDRLHADLETIARDLHCTTVMLIGSEIRHLMSATRWALDAGLDVYVRPDPTDLPRPTILQRLDATATTCESLLGEFPGRVTLVVGSEFSHTAPGIVPGPRSFLRLHLILRTRGLLRRRVARRLHGLLTDAAHVARTRFNGPITYSAAAWEDVDWSLFDVVGVSLYRSRRNEATYADRVRSLVERHDQPVVITEFGCGAFDGADQRGAGSFQIVNWFADPPRITGDHPRDEGVQARYLADLIAIYEAEGVRGCFVFTYAMPAFHRDADPSLDIDRAGFGIVTSSADGARRPKQAFFAVAGCYRDSSSTAIDGPR